MCEGGREDLRADEESDGFGAMGFEDRAKATGDLVRGLPNLDRLERSIGRAALGLQQAVGVGVQVADVPTLGAGEPVRERMLAVALDAKHAPALHVDPNSAMRGTDPAVGRVRAPVGHGMTPIWGRIAGRHRGESFRRSASGSR